MRIKPVYIAGAGVASPFGDDLESVWQALLSAPPLRRQTLRVGGQQRDVLAHITSPSRYETDAEEYFVSLCRHAIEGLLAQCSLGRNKRGCLLLGTGMGAYDRYLSDEPIPVHWEEQIIRRVTDGLLDGLNAKWIANACCAGAQAVAYGCDLLRLGKVDYVIAGGAEAFSYLTFAGFERLGAIDLEGCKPFDRHRRGISVGDGAAFFLLSTDRPGTPLACLLGHGITSDAHHIVTPAPDGRAMRYAIEQALRRSWLHPGRIQAVIAHGTGTLRNDAVESDILDGLFGRVSVTAPKGALGHTGGASGPFNLLAAIGCLQHQTLPAIARLSCPEEGRRIRPAMQTTPMHLRYLLVNCFAFGGVNLSMVCADADEGNYPRVRFSREPLFLETECFGQSKISLRRSLTLPWPERVVPPAGAVGRTMDSLCVRLLSLAEALLKTETGWAGRCDVGVVLSVDSGMQETLSQCAQVLRQGEPKQLNPSRFPYVMLSTALSCLTQRLETHGPSCVLIEKDQAEAEQYARVQLESGQCSVMLCFSLREGRFLRADIWERENQARNGERNEGCAD